MIDTTCSDDAKLLLAGEGCLGIGNVSKRQSKVLASYIIMTVALSWGSIIKTFIVVIYWCGTFRKYTTEIRSGLTLPFCYWARSKTYLLCLPGRKGEWRHVKLIKKVHLALSLILSKDSLKCVILFYLCRIIYLVFQLRLPN